MIRICKDNKVKYKSIGLSAKLKYWDFKKNRPRVGCPNKELILKIILEKETEYQKQILELKSEDKEFTASTLIAPKTKVSIKTVQEFYEELIKEFELSNRIGNSRIYKGSLRSLEMFYNSKLDIPFSHIDMDFLKSYEKCLRNRSCGETSMSIFFRTLRSVYNKDIEAKYAKKASLSF